MYKDPIARILQHMCSKNWRERRATHQNKGRVSRFQRKNKGFRGEKTIHQNSKKKLRREERARKVKIQSFKEREKQATHQEDALDFKEKKV